MRLPHALILGQLGRCFVHGGRFGGIVAASETLEILFRLEEFEEIRNVLIVGPDLSRAAASSLVQGIGTTLYRRRWTGLSTAEIVVFQFAAASRGKLTPPVTKAAAVAVDGCGLG